MQQARVAEGAAVAEEVMAALERNGVSFVGGGLGKAKKDGSGKQLMGRAALLQLTATVRIDIPPTSPGRAALKVWEELVNVLRKDGADPAAAFVHRKKVQHAEKNIRDAFLALYRGLELLKKFRYMYICLDVCLSFSSVARANSIAPTYRQLQECLSSRHLRVQFISLHVTLNTCSALLLLDPCKFPNLSQFETLNAWREACDCEVSEPRTTPEPCSTALALGYSVLLNLSLSPLVNSSKCSL